MRYLKLEGPELQPLLVKMVARGEPLPNPFDTTGFVAVDDGGAIRAEIVVQRVYLVEPATAEKGFGHCLGPLFMKAQELITESGAQRAIMHTDNKAMERMLDRAKARPWPVKMWQWIRKVG